MSATTAAAIAKPLPPPLACGTGTGTRGVDGAAGAEVTAGFCDATGAEGLGADGAGVTAEAATFAAADGGANKLVFNFPPTETPDAGATGGFDTTPGVAGVAIFGSADGGVKPGASGRVTFSGRPAAGAAPGITPGIALPDGVAGFGGREILMVSFFNFAGATEGAAGVTRRGGTGAAAGIGGRGTAAGGTGGTIGAAGGGTAPGAADVGAAGRAGAGGGGTGSFAPVGKFGLGGGGGVSAIIDNK